MKMASVMKKTGKAVLAALLALLILNIFCFFYFNRPSHAKSDSGATDYTWEPDSTYFDMTEGFAFNRTNNEGYFNPYDYEAGMNIDVLILGASQMQSTSVQMKYSTPVLLSQKLDGQTVYNLGMAGHLFDTLAANLDAALEKYQPKDFVVMEMETVIFNDDTLNAILNNTVPEMKSYTGGWVNLLQRVDVLRLLYSQASAYMETHSAQSASAEEYAAPLAAESQKSNEELLRETLARLKASAEEHGVQLIILFDPKCFFSEEGYLWFGMANEAELFSNMCSEEGIIFVNMCPRFEREYIDNATLPYGFTNTSKGEGHLNKYGHAAIADELCKAIIENS